VLGQLEHFIMSYLAEKFQIKKPLVKLHPKINKTKKSTTFPLAYKSVEDQYNFHISTKLDQPYERHQYCSNIFSFSARVAEGADVTTINMSYYK